MAKKKPTTDDLAAFSTQPSTHPTPDPTPGDPPPTPVLEPRSGGGAVDTLGDLVRDLTEKLAESQRLQVSSADRQVALREENAGLRTQLDAERDRRRQAESEIDRERRRLEAELERERRRFDAMMNRERPER